MTDIEKIHKAGYTAFSIGRDKAAKLLGITRDQARRRLTKLRNGAVSPKADMGSTLTEAQEQTSDKWNIELPRTRICTLDELIEQFKVDLTTWEVERFIANKWEVGAKSEDGSIVVEPLYQIKATFKRITGFNLESVRAEIERLKAAAKVVIAPFGINKSLKHGHGKENALEISIADLHLGKLGWGEETLGANYDHKIARKLYQGAFTDILQRTTVPLERICLVLGNDLLNSETRAGATVNNTIQSNDGRYMKSFQAAFDLLVKQINTSLEVAPVDVLMVPGNHDEHSVWHLGHSLECMYAGNKYVKIDNTPSYFKFWQFGYNMVMATHGNEIKQKELPLMMATTMRKMFGETKYNEVHLGHLHQTSLFENYGIRVRIIPSLTAPDWWHSQHGYTNQVRAGQGFVWNKSNGLIEIKEHCIDRLAE